MSRRAALVTLGLLCVCCAGTPELLRARDVGAKDLGCIGTHSEAKLVKETSSWRIYNVECDLQVVRVACSEEQACQIEARTPRRPPFREQML